MLFAWICVGRVLGCKKKIHCYVVLIGQTLHMQTLSLCEVTLYGISNGQTGSRARESAILAKNRTTRMCGVFIWSQNRRGYEIDRNRLIRFDLGSATGVQEEHG